VAAEQHRGDGHRDSGLVGKHFVRVDDPLLGDDVSELRLVRVDGPARRSTAIGLTAPDPKVEFVAAPRTSAEPANQRALSRGSAHARKVCATGTS
jgi:hypothetical protein